MKKLLLSAVAIIAFASISFGQTASATASGTITAANSVTKSTDLNFANVATGPAGTVILTASTGLRTKTGSLILTGTPVFATFDLVGSPTQNYNFTIPTAAIATTTNPIGATPMTVDTWNSVPNSIGGAGNGSLAGGVGTITIGATLHVGAGQLVGSYTTAPFDVTVIFE